jgi:hypothetical protein
MTRAMTIRARAALREMLHDELASIHALNQVLRQPGLHDGARADAQKARGIALAEVRHILIMLSNQPTKKARNQNANSHTSATA